MIITLASLKGGVGKTTTAIHLAAYLQAVAGPTLLVDGDPNRSALEYGKLGDGLPFQIATENQAPRLMAGGAFEHYVIDTKARPSDADLEELAQGCDLMVVPTTPEALSLNALSQMLGKLGGIEGVHWKVLLTINPPKPSREADEAREALTEAGIPLFEAGIPRAAAYTQAAKDGLTVRDFAHRRSAELWGYYEALGREVLDQETAK